MRHGSTLLTISAAVLWGTTLVTAVTGFDGNPRVFSAFDFRMWLCTLSLAIITTLIACQQSMAGKAARLYTAMTKAAVTRPPYAEPATGLMERLVTTGPLARILPLQSTHHGRHSHR